MKKWLLIIFIVFSLSFILFIQPSTAAPGILEASASADTTLSATTYTLVDSMTLTPGAGDYLAVFVMGVEYPNMAAADQHTILVSIFVNGVQQAHTEREIFAEESLDSARVPIVTHAHISVGSGEAVEVRYFKSGGSAGIDSTGKNRRLILFPKAAADFSQATATTDDTLATATYTLLNNMALTPGAGDYLAVFTTSGDGPSGTVLAYSLFVGGTQVAHTERTFTIEASISNTELAVLIAAKVSPTAGQAVEVRWARQAGTGTIVTHERTLTLMKVDSADIFEASATADASATNTADAAIDSLSVTPGVATDYLAIFSGSDFYGTIGANEITTYSIYKDGTQASNSELNAMHEASVDSADMAVFDAATVSPTAAQAVTAQWRGSSATSRTIHERTLVLVKEAALSPNPSCTPTSPCCCYTEVGGAQRRCYSTGVCCAVGTANEYWSPGSCVNFLLIATGPGIFPVGRATPIVVTINNIGAYPDSYTLNYTLESSNPNLIYLDTTGATAMSVDVGQVKGVYPKVTIFSTGATGKIIVNATSSGDPRLWRSANVTIIEGDIPLSLPEFNSTWIILIIVLSGLFFYLKTVRKI